MAIHDVRFAWIRELSELITQIDIHVSADEGGADDAVLDQVAMLLGGPPLEVFARLPRLYGRIHILRWQKWK